MSADINDGRRRVLDPIDRNSEVLFGLFMVLTFTGTLSVASAGQDEVRTMLIAAIGCNMAWGFVDGVMYVLRSLVDRGRKAAAVRVVRSLASPPQAHRMIAEEMGPLAQTLQPAELERVRLALLALPASDVGPPRVTARDLRGAVGVFLLVFCSTFPVVLPFVFFDNLHRAMRVSGAIALAMLFVCGHGWGRYAGMRPALSGTVMMLLGVVIQAIVIALGG